MDRNMKHILIIIIAAFCMSSMSQAQFRGQEPRSPSVSNGMTQQQQPSGGIFDLDRLDMMHSVSVSYGMFGDQGLGMSMYVNSMRYRISEPLSVRADIGMMFSPFGSAANLMRNDISGIFLKRASVDYAPSKDFRLSLQFRNEPYMYPYSGWGHGTVFGFDRFRDDDRLFP
jgi:hypothetical protein